MAAGRPLTILALVLASGLVALLPTRVAAAGDEPRRITVRVYRTIDVLASVEERALSEAARLLRTARVDVRWRHCVGQPCDGPSSTELFLRIMRAGSPRKSSEAALGEALVPPQTSAGVLATVFLDRVEWLAVEAGADFAQLLGRVAAHELGHLLMRTGLHAHGGLMRATWTADEVRHDRLVDWAFRPGDVSAIRVAGP